MMEMKGSKHDYSEENMKDMGKVTMVDIKKATNGWTVSYRVKEMSPGAKMSDHVESVKKEMLYLYDKQDEAFDYFKSLKMKEEPYGMY